MGRHTRPHTDPGTPIEPDDGRHRLAMAVRHTIPAGATPSAALDATTTSLRPVAPSPPATDATPAPGVPVPPDGPPARLTRRDRRAARLEQAAQAALAARLSRAQRRTRQVAAFTLPAPRTPDPAMSGPLETARPPWTT